MTSPHGIVSVAHRPPVMGVRGMVASGHPLASMAGMRILMEGGSAIDAAVAVGAALNVVEPQMSGMGGDGFIMLYDSASRSVKAVNATGAAPYGASREFYKRDGIPMKGILSASVPGIVDGWLLAQGKYGKLSLDRVFEPAIELAGEGFPVSHKLAQGIMDETPPFASVPSSRKVFTRDGRPLRAGEMLVQKDLADSFRLIAREGRDAFYKGSIAKAIAKFSQSLGGLLTEKDLADHRSHWDEPISTTYRGHTVYEFPPNSSGHVLLQELNMVERFDLKSLGFNTAESIHLMVEAKRLSFADREKCLADPRWVKVPIKGLLSKDYAAEQAAKINMGKAAMDVRAGAPERHGDTTYFCIADRWGNAVSQLQSLQSGFGSGLIAEGTGILLNNRMTYWHLEDDHVDRLEPGKRVRHTMNPVIVTKNDKLFLILGTPGADTQVQTNLQLITHIIDFGLNPQEAVEAPRWRHTGGGTESTIPHTCPDELHLEGRFKEEIRKRLRAKGHDLKILGDWEGTGNAQVIMIDQETGALIGGSDPRRDGYTVGW